MSDTYHITRTVTGKSFDETIEAVTEALKTEGFGVLTEIDVKATLKKKIDVDFRPYKILGACNPAFAHQALQMEDNLGVMLPCNVIVQEKPEGISVSAIDPIASIGRIGNPALAGVAEEVKDRLTRVLDSL